MKASHEVAEELQELVDEVTDRLAAGHPVDFDALVRDHPQHSQRLRTLIPAMRGMAQLSHETAPAADSDDLHRMTPRELGDFRILRELGRGGMGIVYEAEQLSVGRHVALKVLPLAAMLSSKGLTRFKNEVRAVATLDHPNIVPIYSVGEERGVHYFAMKLIRGRSMAWVVEQLRLTRSPREAGSIAEAVRASTERTGQTPSSDDLKTPSTGAKSAEQVDASTLAAGNGETMVERKPPHRDFCRAVAQLGVQAADALHDAHEHGIVHRDVKPGNLLVDAKGKLWVTDFGLARIESDARLTLSRDWVGTVRYMAPEQALGQKARVDQRVDVYSLGATLYELLVLRPAREGDNQEEMLTQFATSLPTPVRKIEPGIPVELETIVGKAMQLEPSDRYTTAKELGDDLRRFLDDEPIRAKPPTPRDRLFSWSRRHRTLATSVAAALMVAMACLAVATVLIGGSLQRTRVAQQQTLLQRDAALDNLYISNVRLAQTEWENGNLTAVEQLLDAHLPVDGQVDLRGWEWFYLKSLCHRDLATLRGHTAGIRAVAWSPNGQQLASAGDDLVVRVWDAATHQQLLALPGHSDRIASLAWSPDGSQIASAGMDKTVRVWDAANGETVLEITASDKFLWQVAWSPDGSRLATCGGDSLVKVWDAKTGKELRQMKGHFSIVWSVAWSPDGRRLASAGNYEKSEIQIWDAETGTQLRQILKAHHAAIFAVAWSPDGGQLATASDDQTVRIWDVETGERCQEIQAHDGTVASVSWSPDGTQLATSGEDGSVKTWRARDGLLLNVLRGHLGMVQSVQWRPDGKRIASGSNDSTVKIWDPDQEQLSMALRGRGGFSWSADERRLETIVQGDDDDRGSVLEVMEMDSLATRQFTFPRSGEFKIHWQVAARSPDGSRIACRAYASDKSACVTKVFDRATLTEIYSLETLHKSDLPEVRSIAWSPDGRYLATAILDGPIDEYVIVWEMTTGKEVVKLKQQGPVDSVAWSPDGTRVADSSWNQIVKTWEVGTWRELLTLNCHPGVRGRSAGGEHKVVWTPDGSRLGAGTMLGWVIMWDANTGRELLSFKAHTAAIRSIAISPDGLRIATASRGKSVKIWDMAGRQLLTLRGHDGMVNSVAWSPSGTWLISSGGDGLRIWGARSSTTLSTSAAASTSSAWP